MMVGVHDSVVSILETAALARRGHGVQGATLAAERESVASRSEARTWDRPRFRAAATKEKAMSLTSLAYGAEDSRPGWPGSLPMGATIRFRLIVRSTDVRAAEQRGLHP